MIHVRDLVRTFRMGRSTVQALDGVNLEIETGEAIAIVGPSGSGKSTLLYMIGGLDTPTSGTVEVDGWELSALTESEKADYRRRAVGFVFQDFYLQPHLDTLTNVELPLKLEGVRRRERREAAMAALDQVGLADRARHRPRELSGGERQRVCIARAFVHGPSILLADEPTGNLDSRTGLSVMKIFLDLWREHGATLIVVTHNVELATTVGRIVTLRDGRIDSGGTDAGD